MRNANKCPKISYSAMVRYKGKVVRIRVRDKTTTKS